MEKALEIINSNKIYIEIFKNVMKKYKQYSKITGYFNITPKNNEEMDILASFDTNVYNNKKAKIKSKDVEKLFTKKLKNFDFLQLLSVVTKEELITNKQVREILVNNEVEFFSTLIKFCENGIGKEWIISALQKKLYGYPSIKKLYKKALDESNINYLKEDLIKCINAINNLPYLENKYESLAIFSARHTKDPHFFDKDSIYGKLLINALVYKDSQGVNKNEINNIDKLNKLYYRFGLLKDEISNSTCIYKLTGELEGNRIDFLNMINEPFNISLSNIQKLDYIICKNNRVFIFENPAVFQSIIQDTDIDESIICTSGQLNLSSYMLLNKIKNLDKIYYAGDFDPEGLQIADKLKDLYNKLGYINQRAVMFNGTVSSNIAYGENGKGEITKEKIKDAVKVAQAEEFVSKMENAYDAHIAQGGTNVSGGQKQRLSIARAIARDPEIYIFDDSFSALDYKTDSVLRKELKKYTKDATILIVAQRIGTIMNADKIIVLDNGKCAGIGTHKELLKTCDVYKEIALSQLSKEELENE